MARTRVRSSSVVTVLIHRLPSRAKWSAGTAVAAGTRPLHLAFRSPSAGPENRSILSPRYREPWGEDPAHANEFAARIGHLSAGSRRFP